MLIGLGDYVDSYPDTYEVIEYLINLPNFKGVIGNHDMWCLDWLLTGYVQMIHQSQGGQATYDSYNKHVEAKEKHAEFLSAMPSYLEIDNMLFVHGGYDPTHGLCENDSYAHTWDRSMFEYTFRLWRSFKHSYDKIFIGHTTTEMVGRTTPLLNNKIYALDQGAGWGGKLTIMNVDNGAFYQSDFASKLYPGLGR